MAEDKDQPRDVLHEAKAVLDMNDRGTYTQPGPELYPHQWLWDSCFIAIGWRHFDVERAKTEILSLLRGQWHNGMVPNMVFRDDPQYRTDRNVWRSWVNPYAPYDVKTSGITQPPVIAEAVVKIGQKMEWSERRQWYKIVYPSLLAYHSWLYNERDPHGEGLVLQVHPWETGLDNTPPWMAEMHEHQMPMWIRIIEKTKFDRVLNIFRRDTKHIPIDQRFTTIEALVLLDIQRRLRRKAYNIDRILNHSLFAIEDLAFNSMLIRNNTHLREIAKSLKEDLPAELEKRMKHTEKALEELWDPYSSQYYSRNFITHHLIKVPTVATLLPLYAGTIDKERAEKLVKLLENQHAFGPAYPAPSVPTNSFWFRPKLYWQGPTWVNINWLIIEGLKQYGFKKHAEALTESTLEMVKKSGCYEYFDPLTGEPAGAANFSWTAALVIDLLKSAKSSR
ncbi:MAG: trehalase family glycosidase [Candidatus Saccharimonadales bacterium]